MKRVAGKVIYAPTDLIQFFESDFASWQQRYQLEHPQANLFTPDPVDELQRILGELGQAHEQQYLAHLQATGADLCVIPGDQAIAATVAAMQAGHHYLYQAALQHEDWLGYADLLMRVEEPSALGAWSYIPVECKLALHPKPYFVIQSCCYCDLLSQVQGHSPAEFQLILGNGDRQRFRTTDYLNYYRHLRHQFQQFMKSFPVTPMPMPQGDSHGRWTQAAAQVLRDRDHLSQVAHITRLQIRRLEQAGITTMQQLAAIDPTGQPPTVPLLDPQTVSRLQHQARLQKQSQGQPQPCYEVLSPTATDPCKGLALLPPASPLDVYFDMEGYPLTVGGLEYLFGVTYAAQGTLHYQDWWAHNEPEEKLAFEQFIDWVYARWQQDPQMHVYHYAAYEAIALKRLMGRYATRENQLDDLLRAGVLVDLCRIVTQGVRVGGANYSIKTLEKIYWQGRQGDVQTAQDSVIQYFQWLQQRHREPAQAAALLAAIRAYNRDDCDSTKYLTDWLRSLQTTQGITYQPQPEASPAPTTDPPTDQQAKAAAVAELVQQLLAEIPPDVDPATAPWPVQTLLAHLLQFHRREAKPFWWQRFEWLKMTETELIAELDCLAGIERTPTPPYRPTAKSRSLAYDYRFDPTQETKLEVGEECWFVPPEPVRGAKLTRLDLADGQLTVTISDQKLQVVKLDAAAWDAPPRTSLAPASFISTEHISEAIRETVQTWRSTQTLPPSLQDLLARRSPRVRPHPGKAFGTAGAIALEALIQTVLHLDHSLLCIQGPPGSGKTYTAAQIIVRLLAAGNTIAVSSTSHKVIANLLGRVAALAIAEGVHFHGAKIGGTPDDAVFQHPQIVLKAKLQEAHPPAYQLVGATVFQCCRTENQSIWDYLFVDEAGQVALANLIAKARCAKNLVLMGDQMQLEQPLQGSHPGDSGTSALGYFLQGRATVPPELGVFLGVSYRLHPDLCRFISELAYEGRLTHHPDTQRHAIALPAQPRGYIQKPSGLVFVPVEHTDNTQASEEEVAVIAAVVSELTGLAYISDRGQQRGVIGSQDILIVAPYNLQVRKLQAHLSDRARIGTVDKFQGQEAPIVIVSMCASSGEAAPRGLEFLLNRNRFNVAISRAQCLAIVVGSPSLARTPCTTIAQMSLVNAFCKAMDFSNRL